MKNGKMKLISLLAIIAIVAGSMTVLAVDNDNITDIEKAIYSYYTDLKMEKDIHNPKDCSLFHRKYVTKELSELLDYIIKN